VKLPVKTVAWSARSHMRASRIGKQHVMQQIWLTTDTYRTIAESVLTVIHELAVQPVSDTHLGKLGLCRRRTCPFR
jgi:hypothetical protein